ncbi:MAG TPA: hypothetical protein VKZ60_07590 [Chloroflexota bacterium]|jgi:hypothetical protein|nr:hypothetical protein [Chloroflexota bacterium]
MNPNDVERERWGAFYLARLRHLCQVAERGPTSPDVPEPRRLLHKAIFVTYCACVQYGRKEAADRLLASRGASPTGMEASPA